MGKERAFIFKSLYNLGLPRLLRISKQNTVTVLSLHRISEERDFFYNPIKPETFYKLIDYCNKHYTIVSFEQIRKRTKKPKLILSFDDGYYDFFDCVFPYLKNKGLPSNHNVVNACVNNNIPIWTQQLNELFGVLKKNNIIDDIDINAHSHFSGDWINYYMNFFYYLLNVEKQYRITVMQKLTQKYDIISKSKMMSWDDIRYCAENGVEIGSHSYNHDSLIAMTNTSECEQEIGQSIQQISQKIDRDVKIFSCPNGQYNDIAINYLKTTEIQYVLVVKDQINSERSFLNDLNVFNRIHLSDNSISEEILRIELFHSKLKRQK